MKIMDSRVESVTVWRTGARVNRIVEVSRKNGTFPTRVEVPLLPLALFDPMVRVRVTNIEGTGGTGGDRYPRGSVRETPGDA